MTIFVNPAVASLTAYVPGDQPWEPGYIKLNTNESPFPPSPEVIEAVSRATALGEFNKYPDPKSKSLRHAIARQLGFEPCQVLAGNGSDEVLRLLCHAFLRPRSGDCIGMLYPTYTLYKTLAEMFGCGCEAYQLPAPDYSMPAAAINADVKIFFIANPNPPLGILYKPGLIANMAEVRPERLIVIDEAYADFAGSNCLDILNNHENVVITRTFSKSYSLAGIRVGFILAHEPIIAQLTKIKDSYNLNQLSQKAAEAAWLSASYYKAKNALIRENRDFLTAAIRQRGFEVPESFGNFIFARRRDAEQLYAELKQRKILVRYFNAPALRDGVRITIGARKDLESLLSAIDKIDASRA